jgi:hypothetical protein
MRSAATTTLAALLVFGVGVGALGAKASAQAAGLDDARLAPVRGELTQAVEAARAEGLPSDWLLEKVREGLSKRVPPPMIARAVTTLLARMRTADALVSSLVRDPVARRPLLRAAVDALAAGAPERPLRALVREAAQGGGDDAPARASEALVTVAELAERGFSGDAAVSATADAYRRGRRAGLFELLSRARRLGPDTPGGSGRDDALRRVGRSVGSGGGPPVDRGAQGRDHGAHGPPGRLR